MKSCFLARWPWHKSLSPLCPASPSREEWLWWGPCADETSEDLRSTEGVPRAVQTAFELPPPQNLTHTCIYTIISFMLTVQETRCYCFVLCCIHCWLLVRLNACLLWPCSNLKFLIFKIFFLFHRSRLCTLDIDPLFCVYIYMYLFHAVSCLNCVYCYLFMKIGTVDGSLAISTKI